MVKIDIRVPDVLYMDTGLYVQALYMNVKGTGYRHHISQILTHNCQIRISEVTGMDMDIDTGLI